MPSRRPASIDIANAEYNELFLFAKCRSPKISEEITRAQIVPRLSSVIRYRMPLKSTSSKIAEVIPIAKAGNRQERGFTCKTWYPPFIQMTRTTKDCRNKPIRKPRLEFFQNLFSKIRAQG